MAGGVPKKVIEMLGQVPLFSACTKAELRTIAGFGTRVPIGDGKTIIEQGKRGFEFFLIVAGKARCLVDGVQVATFGPGDFFGEMALLDRGPRHATVIAEGPVEVLVLDSREFDSLLEASPSIAKKLLVAFAARERQNASIRH